MARYHVITDPMAVRVKLRDVVEALDLPSQDWRSYLNRDTGAIVTVTGEGRLLDDEDSDAEETGEDLDSDRFLALPDSFEVHEWLIMDRFALDRSNARQRDDLLDALQGRGAFRMFKSRIRSLGIENDWYRFRTCALEEIARGWLKSNQIEYD